MFFTARRRQRQYYPRLRQGWSTEPYQRLRHLTTFWQRVNPHDLTGLSAQTLLRCRLTVRITHLPVLIRRLNDAVMYLADEREMALEQLNQQRPNRRDVTLDVFLSDEHGMDVDLPQCAKELTQLLILLELDAERDYQETLSDYIPRMTDTLLEDVATFTHTLFEGLSYDVT